MAESLKGNVSGLTCPVCYNSYKTNEENSVPRSLNCGHTYCTGCLEKLMSDRNDTFIIRCPTCKRETVSLTVDRTSSLPKNYGLLEVVSLYEKDEAQVKNYNDSVPLSTDKPVCSEHDEPMKVYCHTDECLICIYCQVYGEHAGHNCELLCKLVKAKKESILDVQRHCMESLKSLLQTKARNEELFASIRRKENGLEEKITGHFKELHFELEKREKCLKRRMHSKIREQAITLLKQERMLYDLINKGNELRKRCSKLLKSSDYAILAVEKGSLSGLMDELWKLNTSCDSNVPKPSCELSWDFDAELVDVIKLHGQIVEKNESRSNVVTDNDQIEGQFHDDVLETLEKMFDNGTAQHDVTVSNAAHVNLDGTNIESFNEEQNEHEEQLTIEDIDLDEHEVLEGAVDLAQGNNTLINDLRSEMRREIRRLKNISIPVSIEVLSDSSSENEEREDDHIVVIPATGQQELISDRIREMSLQSPPSDAPCHAVHAGEEQDSRHGDRLRHDVVDHQSHHLHEHHKHHQRAVQANSFLHQCLAHNATTGMHNLPHKCHRTRATSPKHGQRTRHQHGQRKHCHHASCLALRSRSKRSGHGGRCHVNYEMVKASGNQHSCGAEPGNATSDHNITVASSDIICPMCTLANEAGKEKCELCGFNLTE